MGFNNPATPWSELERTLSDWNAPGSRGVPPSRRGADGRAPGSPSWNAGGDGPAWSRKRQPFEPAVPARGGDSTGALRVEPGSRVPYAELHCQSNFSFLNGASPPEALAQEAERLGLEALALTDQNGFYGVVRFAEAARVLELPTVFGAELTLGLTRYDPGLPDPPGEHVVLLADGPSGYARLARAISLGQLAGEKGAPRYDLAQLSAVAAGDGRADQQSAWWVLTGCRNGVVPAALVRDGPAAAARQLQRLISLFGRERVVMELWDHGDPLDSARNDALVEIAGRHDIECIATNDVHYATPQQRRLATALAAVRARRSLEEMNPWLPAGATAHLRSGAEMEQRFIRYPGVIERAAVMGRAAAFDLSLVAPKLPPFDCEPDEHGRPQTEMQFLRTLAERGGLRRYGKRPHHGGNDMELRVKAWRTIDHELEVIEDLGYPGYFLVVWDIVRFCEKNDILCQGRGSAANSAVCYALGITNADAVRLGLLFERFLSADRDEPPDIDIDIESDRREEVIQHVYRKHDRHHAAQVANVVTYRARSAVRDMAKALGYAPGQQDAWSKQIDMWGGVATTAAQKDQTIPADVLELAAEVEDAPRHLGIHSGGMVICDRPIIEVCPVEWGRMADRSVLQWDKDDCAAAGLVKFDLLGLGMLSALHYALDLMREHQGRDYELATIPLEDPDVYEMLCQADTVGVFQIESRAQMATLPRLQPRTFYDLVVEVALIRPGPIQGGSVHPYIRHRKMNKDEIPYLHPLLKGTLERTLGVPLFQEQLMQMAMVVAGFTAAEADQLRQAMGSKRSHKRMEELRERLFTGMAERDITGDLAEELYAKMAAFANYGFPESHAVSFAYLVYASSWIKFHEPAVFCAALLNAQPMGFWSPHSLVQDALRHEVLTRTPDLNESLAKATLQPDPRSKTDQAVRLGLESVRGIGADLAKEIEAERVAGGPYRSPEDLIRRVPTLDLVKLESLATAGAFTECFGIDRREALWVVGAVAQSRPDRLEGVVTGSTSPRLPGMDPVEIAVADLWATGVAPDGHPTRFLRDELDALGVVTSVRLWKCEPGTKVLVAGVVTHRQRPMTAQGITFMNLEDETGLINIVCSKGCWVRYRKVAREARALLIRGTLERSEGVINIVAEQLTPLQLLSNAVTGTGKYGSRDFR